MSLTPLTALSPVDGRYASRCAELRGIFSETGLIRARVRVEVGWLQALAQHRRHHGAQGPHRLPTLAVAQRDRRRVQRRRCRRGQGARARDQSRRQGGRVLSSSADSPALDGWVGRLEFVHFACTSEDINNLAYALHVPARRATASCCRGSTPLVESLRAMAHAHADDAMMSRTHGQPATPTTLGKEVAVFVHRLRSRRADFAAVLIRGKCNGAVGNFNAHVVAYPELDWPSVAGASSNRSACVHSPLYDADRAARLDGGVLRCAGALQQRADRSVPRFLGLRVARLFPAEGRRGRSRLVDDAAQGQPDRLRECRRQLRLSPTRCCASCRRSCRSRAGSAT